MVNGHTLRTDRTYQNESRKAILGAAVGVCGQDFFRMRFRYSLRTLHVKNLTDKLGSFLADQNAKILRLLTRKSFSKKSDVWADQ